MMEKEINEGGEREYGLVGNTFRASFSPDEFFKNLDSSEIHWIQAMSIFLIYIWFILAYQIGWEFKNLIPLSILIMLGPATYFGLAFIARISFGKIVRPLHLVGWMHAPLLLMSLLWLIVKGIGWFIGLLPMWLIEVVKRFGTMFLPAPGPVLPPFLPLLFMFLSTIWPLWILYHGVNELRPARLKIYWIWALIYVIWDLNIYRLII